MPDAIGAQSFVRIEWDPDLWEPLLLEISRDGIDGHEYRKLGLKSEPTVLRASRDYASSSSLVAAIATMKALVGTVQTVSMYGRSLPGVRIRGCRVVPGSVVIDSPVAIGGIVGGSCWIAFDFLVQKVTSAGWT